jgi:hypothetical protein
MVIDIGFLDCVGIIKWKISICAVILQFFHWDIHQFCNQGIIILNVY